MLNKSNKIYVAGSRGMVGSAIVENLKANDYTNIISASSNELDLRNQHLTNDFIAENRPDIVIIAAARVGGILANNEYPWQFLYDNLMIQANLIRSAHTNDISKLIFLGSSCIYPKNAPQPLKEEYLLTGSLEPTNEWYAIAKIAGVKMCQALNRQYGRHYISLMPTNLYGQRDNFDLKTSHVLPALIRKFHEAKLKGNSPVLLWGSGSPLREFLHVEDLAESVRFIMEYNDSLQYDMFNVGVGKDLSIKELAKTIQSIVGHKGEVNWDSSKPDGTPRKLMDTSLLNEIGWNANIKLDEGIQDTYEWFLANIKQIKELEIF